MKKKTHEEYVAEISIKNPNVEVIGKYAGAKTKIRHHCLKHDIYWDIQPSSVLQGHGCVKCKSDKISNKLSKTHEQYINELKNINPNIKVIEKYIGANTPILHKCLIDGYEWYAQPSNILSGYGCPKCSQRFRRSHDDYVQEVFEFNPNIEVIGTFKDLQTPILHKCKIHNVEWMAYPEFILKGCGCFECGNEKIKEKLSKMHERYVQELKEVNPNVEVIDTYINSLTPILHKCLIDGYEWYVKPSNILSGYGCPKCNESKGEKIICEWLNKHNIKYDSQKRFVNCRDKNPLPFDFYLPEYNCCIEYQGKQHYEPIKYFGGQEQFEYIQKHDVIKNEYCKNNGIPLLRIPYYKFDNIEEELNNFLFI